MAIPLTRFTHNPQSSWASLSPGRWAGVVLCLYAANLWAAVTPPTEDINFLAEHLAEAAQDARYFAMPWPGGNHAARKGWRPVISVAASSSGTDFATTDGGLLTLGASRSLSPRRNIDLLAYFDQFNVSGSSTDNVLSAYSLNGVPLDLPETALFTRPRGRITHSGLAALITSPLQIRSDMDWSYTWGLSIEQLDLENYRFDYRLTGGNDAGATGFIDYSGSQLLVYAMAGLQTNMQWNQWQVTPRAVLGLPLKKGDFTARMTGPGFDLNTASTDATPHKIGDGFLYLGASFRIPHTQLEMDLGALLGYALFERLTHEGIQSAAILSITWRP